jgi:hypothetical protein
MDLRILRIRVSLDARGILGRAKDTKAEQCWAYTAGYGKIHLLHTYWLDTNETQKSRTHHHRINVLVVHSYLDCNLRNGISYRKRKQKSSDSSSLIYTSLWFYVKHHSRYKFPLTFIGSSHPKYRYSDPRKRSTRFGCNWSRNSLPKFFHKDERATLSTIQESLAQSERTPGNMDWF